MTLAETESYHAHKFEPLALRAPSLTWQGHVLAGATVANIHFWGQGVAIDYPRAMAAYKFAADRLDLGPNGYNSAGSGWSLGQCQIGLMYYSGQGVDVDYEQAAVWLEKAASQDEPEAIGQLGLMVSSSQLSGLFIDV